MIRTIIRVALVSGLVVVGAFVIPELVFRGESERRAILASSVGREGERLFDAVFSLGQRSQLNVTNDYSYWDDMVDFAAGALDDEWGFENLSAGLESFSINNVWVIGPDERLRYGLRQGPEDDEPFIHETLPISVERIRDAVASDSVALFYVRQDEGVSLVMAAGIVPTADAERETSPQGYFVTAADIDVLTDEVGAYTAATIDVTEPSGVIVEGAFTDIDHGIYRFDRTLKNDLDEDVAKMSIIREFPSIRAIFQGAHQNEGTVRILLGLAVLSLAAALLSLDISRGRALQTAARLRELAREKYDFITAVSHQLRTPLSVSNSYVELAGDELSKKSRPAVKALREYLQIIGQSNAQTGLLLRDMFSFIELSDYGAATKERFDVSGEIRKLLSVFEQEAIDKKLSVTVDVPGNILIEADPPKFRLALQHLLENAMTYTDEGGSIGVSARRDGSNILIDVTDDGIGIPSSDRAKVFDLHFRAKNAYEKKSVGTGLGLPIARNIVRGHGGDITFESKLGEGTTFTISVPAGKVS